MALKFDLLTENQVFNKNEKLDILKRYGTRATLTDYAILLGGNVDDDSYTSEGNYLKNRSCNWVTNTPFGTCSYVTIDSLGTKTSYEYYVKSLGVRPSISYSKIQQFLSNKQEDNLGIISADYGEYPQTVVDETHSIILEKLYNNGSLTKTGKTYTNVEDKFRKKHNRYIEYVYNGSKYIRYLCKHNFTSLSNGKRIKKNMPYWVKVEPITWLIDKKTGIALSKKILFSGMELVNAQADFIDSIMDHINGFHTLHTQDYLKNGFGKDIIPSKVKNKTKIEYLEDDSSHEVDETTLMTQHKLENKKQELENIYQKVLYMNVDSEEEKKELENLKQTLLEQQQRLDSKIEELEDFEKGRRMS